MIKIYLDPFRSKNDGKPLKFLRNRNEILKNFVSKTAAFPHSIVTI